MGRISHFHDTNMLIDNVIRDEIFNRHRYCDKPIRKVAISASLARVRLRAEILQPETSHKRITSRLLLNQDLLTHIIFIIDVCPMMN